MLLGSGVEIEEGHCSGKICWCESFFRHLGWSVTSIRWCRSPLPCGRGATMSAGRPGQKGAREAVGLPLARRHSRATLRLRPASVADQQLVLRWTRRATAVGATPGKLGHAYRIADPARGLRGCP
jgi:hypothetical protein